MKHMRSLLVATGLLNFPGILLADPSALTGANPAASAPAPAGDGLFWYKGNTHTHTWWSDGDTPPDAVMKWYKEHGYNFLMLSDHNRLAQGERWYHPKTGSQEKAAALYEKTFGPQWVVKRGADDTLEYRLKTLKEYAPLFADPGKFLPVNGEEITDGFEGNPIHVNAVNIVDEIPPQKGKTIAETIQNDVDAVKRQEAKYKQPMLAHVDHPNFRWALRVEDILSLKNDQFFEVHNGHHDVHNYGDENRMGTERMWDVMLAKRLGELGLPIMYGVATDDAHCYTKFGPGVANPGRGWVMVRASELTANALVRSMQRGEFYATTGVVLKDVRYKDGKLSIEIDAQPGVTYTTQFIGTLEGFDPKPADRYKDPRGFLYNKYTPEIGKVLVSEKGSRAEYKLTGKEIYVRAKIISNAPHANPFQEGDVQVAWVQPVTPANRPAPAVSKINP